MKKLRSGAIVRSSDNSSSADTEKANLLNDYFTAQTFLDENNGSFPQTIPIHNYRLVSLTLLPTEVEEILKSLPLGKAAGPDSINNRVLKELAQPLSIPLCNLFNFSLTTGKVSKIWKQANVSPIYKKNDPSDVSNYRPISLLSTNGGSTRFPMTGRSFYEGYSINCPLKQDTTLITLHIYSQSITNGPANNLTVTETVSDYWDKLCANVNITPPPY